MKFNFKILQNRRKFEKPAPILCCPTTASVYTCCSGPGTGATTMMMMMMMMIMMKVERSSALVHLHNIIPRYIYIYNYIRSSRARVEITSSRDRQFITRYTV